MPTVMVKVKDMGNFSVSEMQKHLENYANSLFSKDSNISNPVNRLLGALSTATISLEKARQERLTRQ